MKYIHSLRAWLDRHLAPRVRYALLAALCVMLLLASPALAQTGVTVFALLGVQDGSESAPGYTFLNDFDTGWYRIGSGNIGYSANGTRVFDIASSGAVTGYLLQYPTTGQRVVCGSTTITGTGVIAHGLATPQYVLHNLAGDATGNGNLTSHTNISGVVTLKIWNSALTPAAATTPLAVDWCAVGTP